MKKIIFYVIILISLNSCENYVGEVQQSIKDVNTFFNLDKRTSIFNIKVKKNNDGVVLTGETNLVNSKIKLLELLTKKNIKFIDSIEYLPTYLLKDTIYGIAAISVVNVRSKPSLVAELSTQVTLGSSIRIFKEKNGWVYIQTPDKYLGWVHSKSIVKKTVQEDVDYLNSKRIIITSRLILAHKSKRGKEVVSDLIMGDILQLLKEDGAYYFVKFPTGETAYILKKDAKKFHSWLLNIDLTRNSIVEESKQYLGVQYLWGGNSIKGFDCSGFVKTLYFMNGIIIPRDASQQVHYGAVVDISRSFETLRKGDLMFFGRIKSGKKRITHVGMYIGDMEYIHCAGAKVRINSLDSTKNNFSRGLCDRFYEARAIIDNIDGEGLVSVYKSDYFFN